MRRLWRRARRAARRALRAAEEKVKETIGDVKEAGEDLKDDWEEFVDNATEAWNQFSKIVADGFNTGGLLVGVGTFIVSFGAFGLDIMGDIAGFFASATGSILKGFVSVFISDRLGGWLKTIFDYSAAIARGTFSAIGDLIYHGVGWVICKFRRSRLILTVPFEENLSHVLPTAPGAENMTKVRHIFVLMLENRSFDHMLGYCNVPGVDKIEGKESSFVNHLDDGSQLGRDFQPGTGALDFITIDPPHDFKYTQAQISGGSMRNFVQAAHDAFLEAGESPHDLELVVKSFRKETLPILHTLASEFVVCDRWFSSVPSATFANRLFLHAASSGGLASQPKNWQVYDELVDGLQFENGTIFDRLQDDCIDWKVYSNFWTSFVKMVVPSPVLQFSGTDPGDHFKSLEDLRGELEGADESYPSYIHIEPNLMKESSFSRLALAAVGAAGGDSEDYKDVPSSQHPDDRSVEPGEKLIKYVYESLRASPIWYESVLIITYDEGGGFFDHVVPPSAVPPGDKPFWRDGNREQIAKDFKFDRLGIRVPAIVVSPLVDRGYADHTEYDFSSVVKSLTQRFGLRHLTERDKAANSIWHLIRNTPRDDCPTTLPPTVRSDG